MDDEHDGTYDEWSWTKPVNDEPYDEWPTNATANDKPSANDAAMDAKSAILE